MEEGEGEREGGRRGRVKGREGGRVGGKGMMGCSGGEHLFLLAGSCWV